MFTIEFIEDNTGELTRQALDEAKRQKEAEIEATRCPECQLYHGAHRPPCSLVTVESLRKDLESSQWLEKHNRTARDIQFRRMTEQLTFWQGKFHALRHENNKLRRRLNINVLQPTVRERAIEALKQLKGFDLNLDPEEAKKLYELNIRSLAEDFTAATTTRQALDEGYQAVEVALGPEGVRALVEERNTAQAQLGKAHDAKRVAESESLAVAAELDEAHARVRELEAQLAAETKRWLTAVDDGIQLKAERDAWHKELTRWKSEFIRTPGSMPNSEIEARVAHWQEEYRDAISRYQRMIEERNGLRLALQSIWGRCAPLEIFAGGVGDQEWLQETVVAVGNVAQAALTPKENGESVQVEI
jgi:regulator of replication initiation timing